MEAKTAGDLRLSHAPVNDPNAPVSIEGGRIYADTSLGPCWRQDHDGRWYVPQEPDLHCAAIAGGGKQISRRDTYQGDSETIERVATILGSSITIPDVLRSRPIQIFAGANGIFCRANKYKDDDTPAGWASPNDRHWEVHVCDRPQQPRQTIARSTLDDLVRVVTYGGHSRIYHRLAEESGGHWVASSPSSAIRILLAKLEVKRSEAEALLGGLEYDTWKAVDVPFGIEYPGPRQWNRDPITWAVDLVPGPHPTWDMVLSHIGTDLEPHCHAHGFDRGADYLFTWLAAMVLDPFGRLPYLFLVGPEDSGKSTLHEAFALLINRGVVKADRALTSQSDFNGELQDALLCVVEEVDVAKAPGARSKMKEAVTAQHISIRAMNRDAFMVPNKSHWIQCANESSACPLFDGDTRVQPIYVPRPKHPIPKAELFARLKAEAPHFAYALTNAKLPEARGRLRLPIIDTPTRQRLINQSRPDWILAIPMVLETQWTGTVSDLAVLLREAGAEDVPATMRRIRAGLTANRSYLSSHRIDFDIAGEGNRTRTLRLWRNL